MAYTRMSDCGRCGIAIFCVASLLALSIAQATPQTNGAGPAPSGHESMDMNMSMAMPDQAPSGPQQQTAIKDKKESEFNHHLAGFLVILAGLFLLGENTLRQRWPQVRFAWPACFLLAGLFLLVFSDTELWPFGPQSWWYGLSHNTEDLQHKTFAAILLALGILEMQRARGDLKSAWTRWAFPVLALFGSALLLFHDHHSGICRADHMAVMTRIQAEHLHFAIAGCSIGFVKGLSELPTRWKTLFLKAWPVVMIALGILLMCYVE